MSAPLDPAPEPIIRPLPDTPSFNARLQELLQHYYIWCAERYHEERTRESYAQFMERTALPAIPE